MRKQAKRAIERARSADQLRSRSPLRIGVLLDSLVIRSWVARILQGIEEAPYAEISLVVLNSTATEEDRLFGQLWQRRRHLLYSAYSHVDRRLFRLAPDPFARVSVADVLGDKPTLQVEPKRRRFSDRFPANAVREIRSFDLDVALRFGFRILRGEVLQVARHGIWSFHHGDIRDSRGGPPGFWEVMEGAPVTGSVLQRLTEELDGGEVLYRSFSPTHRRSVARNKHHLYWKSAAFVSRALRSLHDLGAPPTLPDSRPPEPLRRKPGNLAFVPTLARFALRAGSEKLTETLTRNQWLPAFKLSDDGEPGPQAASSLRPILPPPDRYWADPFPVRRGDRYHVFLEEYVYRRGRGHISVLEIDDQGNVSPPVPVLEADHHLSYPFVFRWQGEQFMIPESAASRSIDLYRCQSFPGDWTLEARLLDDVHAVDATLWQQDETWWMFVNMAEEGALHARDELHLFHAESPLGPWSPHRRNPVVSDARCARPAGRLFRWRGDLCRPAQDCSWRYGRAVVFHRVLELSLSAYREQVFAHTEPDWSPGLLATHTYNRRGRLTIVDGMRRLLGPP